MKNKKILSFIICILTGVAVWFVPLGFLGLDNGNSLEHYFAGLLVFFSLLGVFNLLPALLAIMLSALLFRGLF